MRAARAAFYTLSTRIQLVGFGRTEVPDVGLAVRCQRERSSLSRAHSPTVLVV